MPNNFNSRSELATPQAAEWVPKPVPDNDAEAATLFVTQGKARNARALAKRNLKIAECKFLTAKFNDNNAEFDLPTEVEDKYKRDLAEMMRVNNLTAEDLK